MRQEDFVKRKKTKLARRKNKSKVSFKKCIIGSEDSEDEVPIAQLCDDDDEDDDIENRDICAICQEFGRDGEIWFRCCRCSGWIHKECSGKDSADNFMCDFCFN
ncbi:unnamed protein product [Euphydryas editha]|uniref:Zinc finger PHD-type domain-containing protein n=1 Tax=Euphydryas editha TaxID=104508 RepID=A0AAU9UIE9_EUPED|nr:unnamed protein product [Euphydryas editha]